MQNSNSSTTCKFSTIDIHRFLWWDKVNGNTYASASVILDYGTPASRTYSLPFGYGRAQDSEIIRGLVNAGEISGTDKACLSGLCYDLKVIVRNSEKYVKKAEAKAYATHNTPLNPYAK